jgi:hypothetical protein
MYGIIINRNALPDDLQQPVVRDSFYNQGIRNVLQREHSYLLERTAFTTPAGKGVEVKFSLAATPTGQASVQYIRTALVGNVSYTFTFQPRDDHAGSASEQRRRFFSSITVTP